MKTRTYKTFAAAKKAAHGLPILQVADLYIVFVADDIEAVGVQSINLLNGNGGNVGTVTLRHLDRLGNANWATTKANAFQRGYASVFSARDPNT